MDFGCFKSSGLSFDAACYPNGLHFDDPFDMVMGGDDGGYSSGFDVCLPNRALMFSGDTDDIGSRVPLLESFQNMGLSCYVPQGRSMMLAADHGMEHDLGLVVHNHVGPGPELQNWHLSWYYSNYQDGRNDTRSTMRASDDRTGVRIRSRSRSRSLSPRNNWGHGEQGESRSSSRSDSGSGGGNRSEWAAPVQRQSPDPRGPSPAGDHGHSQMQQRSPVRSAQPYEREEGLIPTGEDGLIPPEEGAGFPVQEPTLVN